MKALIFGLNWIGDVIMSFPAINAINKRIQIDVLTRPHLAELYAFNNRITNIVKVPTNSGFAELLPYIKSVRKQKYDKIIILPNSLRTALIGCLCGSETYGYKSEGRSIFLSKPVPKPDNFQLIHESELHKQLIGKALEINENSQLVTLELKKSDTFYLLKKRFSLPESGKFIVIAPGAAFGSAKRWPEEKFVELSKMLIQKFNYKILLTGGTAEAQTAEKITKSDSESIINLAGKTSLTELLHLIGNSELLIANDSGTMHLSSLTNTPVAVPVGPTDMIRTGPLHNKSAIVTSEYDCPILPCRRRVCRYAHQNCMTSITAEMMLDKITALLGDKT